LYRLVIENLCFHTMGPINLKVAVSECIGITGPSGAGKTLFLRAVADIDQHTGEIFLDGVESNKIPGPKWRKKVGLLLSESYWWFDTVGEHFKSFDARWFEILGFNSSALKWNVRRLSSGERQRLALLRLLVNRPRVLLLDEPTANLDSENSIKVEKVVKSYMLETESSLIWISHDTEQLKRVSSRYFNFKDGKITDSIS